MAAGSLRSEKLGDGTDVVVSNKFTTATAKPLPDDQMIMDVCGPSERN